MEDNSFNPSPEELRDILAGLSSRRRRRAWDTARDLFGAMCTDPTVTTPTPHAALVEATWQEIYG